MNRGIFTAMAALAAMAAMDEMPLPTRGRLRQTEGDSGPVNIETEGTTSSEAKTVDFDKARRVSRAEAETWWPQPVVRDPSAIAQELREKRAAKKAANFAKRNPK